jgi:hypothetical protein
VFLSLLLHQKASLSNQRLEINFPFIFVCLFFSSLPQ